MFPCYLKGLGKHDSAIELIMQYSGSYLSILYYRALTLEVEPTDYRPRRSITNNTIVINRMITSWALNVALYKNNYVTQKIGYIICKLNSLFSSAY